MRDGGWTVIGAVGRAATREDEQGSVAWHERGRAAQGGATGVVTRGRVSSGTVLGVASFGAFLAFLDATIVNVAFPSIRESFPDSTISNLSWVLNAYNIVFAAFLVPFGRLTDLIGRRRAFVWGVLVFTVASVICALSPSVGFLIGARVVQALGAAMLVPASLALVVAAFPAERRTHAVGLWGASAALASGLGPPIGGLLVQVGDWRWAFLVNLPFGIAAWVLARRSLVESRAPGRRTLPDLGGAALFALALGLLTLGIVQGGDWGWTSSAVIGCFVVAAVLLVLFVASSRRHRSPLLDPELLKVRAFKVGNVATVAAGMGFYAYLLTNILWLTYVWGYSVLRAGLALVPAALIAAVVAAVLGPIAAERGYRLFIIPGALVWASALRLVRDPGGHDSGVPHRVAARPGAQRHRGRDDPAPARQRDPGGRAGWSVRDRLRGGLEHPADGRRPGHRPARGDHRHADAGHVGRLLPRRLVDVGRLLRGGRGHRRVPRADRAGHGGRPTIPSSGTDRGPPPAACRCRGPGASSIAAVPLFAAPARARPGRAGRVRP